MTDPDIPELRRRTERARESRLLHTAKRGGDRRNLTLLLDVLPALLDEIERLRDENDRLNFLVVDKGYDKLHEENEQLRAEVERLRGDWRAEKREKLSWMSEASKAMAKCERLRAVVDAARAWREADDRDCCGACCKCLECLEAELVTAIDALDRSRSRSLGIDRFRCCTMMAPTARFGNRERRGGMRLVKFKDGKVHAYMLRVSESDALALISSMAQQMLDKSPNTSRLESHTTRGEYFSISVHRDDSDMLQEEPDHD